MLAPGEDGAASAATPMSIVLAVVFALSAGWVAAGSAGLLGHSLRHVLTWILCGAAIVAGVGSSDQSRPALRRILSIAAAAVVSVLLAPSILPAVNVAAVVIVAGALAWASGSRALRIATGALATLAVYRVALQSIPTVWLISDRIGEAFGWIAGRITGQPLWVGPTFGGVDFLVLSGAFYGLWLVSSPAPRGRRAIFGGLGILLAHLAYLALLSFAPAFLKDVPEFSQQQPNPVWTIAVPGFVDWTIKLDAVAVRQFVPMDLPLFAVLFHCLANAGMLRWGGIAGEIEATERTPRLDVAHRRQAGRLNGARWFGAAGILAVLLAAVTTWCSPAASLAGKKIVISSRLFGNFLKPQYPTEKDISNSNYGHLSIGMYGNLQPFIESLGGTAVISSDLSDADLKDADALIVIYPNKPFTDDNFDKLLRTVGRYGGWDLSGLVQQAQVDRIWRWVDGGGTLLVMGEHTVADENVPLPARNYLNELLAPSAIRVNFDSATFDVGGWLQSYQALSHPITAGIEDSRNQFGVVIGASLDVKWPARPVLVGRWGWGDPGDEGATPSMMGNHHYDPGERLGDMVLVAEQSYGKGRLMAFGDPSNVTNGITIGAHPFNARLYSYLTHNPATDKDGAGTTPQSGWRQVLGVLLAGVLVWLLAKRAEPLSVATVALVMSLSLLLFNGWVSAAAEIVPNQRTMRSSEIYLDKGKSQPNYSGIAYIDNSHVGFYSEESWRQEGMMGLAMNLMRSNYLTLLAPDLEKERLDGASLLVIPAPTRPLSKTERMDLKKWVQNGGTLIMTIGWDRYLPNRELLADFKFYLERIPFDAVPPEIMRAVQLAHPRDEIINVGVDQRNGFGYYVFDVKRGERKLELLIHPTDGTTVAETEHTPHSWQEAMVKRGDLPPAPMGFFKVPYLSFGPPANNPGYQVYVRFHSAWPIRSIDPLVSVIANHGADALPLIMWRKEGSGKVLLIGDSEFATNINLEQESGAPFEGMRENADFWRWLISYYVRNGRERDDWWRPPNPAPPPATEGQKKPGDAFELEGK